MGEMGEIEVKRGGGAKNGGSDTLTPRQVTVERVLGFMGATKIS